MSKFTTPAILEMPDHYLSDENCDAISASAGFVTDADQCTAHLLDVPAP